MLFLFCLRLASVSSSFRFRFAFVLLLFCLRFSNGGIPEAVQNETTSCQRFVSKGSHGKQVSSSGTDSQNLMLTLMADLKLGAALWTPGESLREERIKRVLAELGGTPLGLWKQYWASVPLSQFSLGDPALLQGTGYPASRVVLYRSIPEELPQGLKEILNYFQSPFPIQFP